MKKCPFCAEEIQDAAIKCRFCGSMLNEPTRAANTASGEALDPDSAVRNMVLSGDVIGATKLIMKRNPGVDVEVAADYIKRIHEEKQRAGVPPKLPQPAESAGASQKVGLASRKRLAAGLVGIFVGFVMTLISATTAGFGMMVLWVGFALSMPGSTLFRWVAGMFLGVLVGVVGFAIGDGGISGSPSASSSPSAVATQPKPPGTTARVADDAGCREDLKCWGEKHMVSASVRCKRPVERMAKNNFEWTDGMFEPKFSHYRWKNRGTGEVTYIGDKIKFQNGFGAWIFHVYECDMDAKGENVTDVRASPGRLN